MKKIHFLLCLVIANQITFAQKNVLTQQTIKVSLLNDNKISNTLASTFKNLTADSRSVMNQTGIPSFTISDFDFANIYKSEKTGESEIAYSADFKNSAGNTKFAFVAYLINGQLSKPMLVKVNSDKSSILYYDLNENKYTDIERSNGSYTYRSSSIDLGASSRSGGTGYGQCVADCIVDAYSNHGWASVWTFVQSIYLPATGVAITLGCIARCAYTPTVD